MDLKPTHGLTFTAVATPVLGRCQQPRRLSAIRASERFQAVDRKRILEPNRRRLQSRESEAGGLSWATIQSDCEERPPRFAGECLAFFASWASAPVSRRHRGPAAVVLLPQAVRALSDEA